VSTHAGRWLEVAVVLGLFAAVTILVFWPAATHLGSFVFATPGALQADGYLITWILAWDVHSLTSAPSALFDANIFYPARGVLAGSEHMLGHLPLFAPVYLLTDNPVLAIQFTRLAAVLLCGVSMYALLRHWGVSCFAAFFGGFVYAFCPTRTLTIHALQLVEVGYLPLAILYLDRVLDRGLLRDAVLLTVFLSLQMLCSFYLAYIALIAVAVYAAGSLWLRRCAGVPSHWSLALLSLAAVGVVVVATSLPYAARGEIPAYDDSVLTTFSAGLWSTYMARPEFARSARLGMAYVGIVPGLCLVAAVWAMARGGARRRAVIAALAVGVAMYVMALGPSLVIGDWRVPLPYKLAGFVIPGFSSMRVPLRFTFGFVFAMAALAGLGLQAILHWAHLDRRKLAAGGVTLAAVLATAVDYGHFEYTPALRPMTTRADLPPVYRRLGDLERGPVLELPTAVQGEDSFRGLDREARYAYLSTFHWDPLLNGYTGYAPRSAAIVKHIAKLLPDARALGLLRRMTGLRTVIVHLDELAAGDRAKWRHPAGLDRLGIYGGDVLFALATRAPVDLVDALISGPVAGQTVLGNSVVQLVASERRGRIERIDELASSVALAGLPMPLRLRVTNESKSLWPVLTGAGDTPVQLEYRWLVGSRVVRRGRLALPYDLAAGHRVRVIGGVPAPRRAAIYDLELALMQGEHEFAGTLSLGDVDVRSL